MQKVDIAIAVLGAVAIISTGLGIGLYDDGNVDFDVSTSDATPLTSNSEVPSSGLEWVLTAPDNAFHAGGELTVSWTSDNPSLDGAVDVTVEVTSPNGHVDVLTGNFQFADGSGVIPFDLTAWADVPQSFSGSQEEADDLALTWVDPLRVEITIQGPSGQVPAFPVGDDPALDDATYTADLDGYWHTFSVLPATPELETV